MAGHFDLVPDLAHHAVLVDQKGGALDPHVFAAIHALLDPHAIGFGHLAVGVGAQDERQLGLFFELVVRGDRVARHADHDGASLAVIGDRVAEAARLGGAARGVVLWIEIEDHRLAAQPRQRDRAVAVGGHREIGGLVAWLDAHRAMSPFALWPVAASPDCALRRAANLAGRAISRPYQERTRAQAAIVSASSRAKSTAPAQRASVAPAGPASAAASGAPSNNSASSPRK